LAFDLVKTRKHWIVTHIECKAKLDLTKWNYTKFEVLTQMNNFLLQNLHLDQDCLILEVVQNFLEKLDKSVSGSDFQALLLLFQDSIQGNLGFAIQKVEAQSYIESTMQAQIVLP
jgi:hypothetical protein